MEIHDKNRIQTCLFPVFSCVLVLIFVKLAPNSPALQMFFIPGFTWFVLGVDWRAFFAVELFSQSKQGLFPFYMLTRTAGISWHRVAWILLSLSLVACGKDPKKKLDDSIKTYASDGKIEGKEFQSLEGQVLKNKKELKEFLAGDEIDYPKLIAHIEKKAGNKVSLPALPYLPVTPFKVNLYFENSGSMFGYVSSNNSGLGNALYEMLARIQPKSFCKEINLACINDAVYPQVQSGSMSQIRSFTTGLSSASLKGIGDPSTSNLDKVLEKVLQEANDQQVSILVSDFIESGSLTTASITIANIFENRLKNSPISVKIIRGVAPFNGKYYGQTIDTSFSGSRPFYVWMIGTPAQIHAIEDAGIFSNAGTQFTHSHQFVGFKPDESIDYKVLPRALAGSYKIDKEDMTKLNKVEKASKSHRQYPGKLAFAVQADLSVFPYPAAYLQDVRNYEVPAGFSLQIQPIRSGNRYTHKFIFSTNKIPNQPVVLNLKKSPMPAWVSEVSCDSDQGFLSNPSLQQRTVGIRHLVEGVDNAFTAYTAEGDIVGRIRVNLEN